MAPLRRGVDGVVDQVHPHLVDFAGVSPDGRDVFQRLQREVDRLAARLSLEKRHGVPKSLVDHDGLQVGARSMWVNPFAAVTSP
ncbi:MAG: hypothetical protein MZV64_28515 [Ignavibacteriales bacterium]|nr:hypothetical protein [Ignavibacteriales bacterium]